MIGENGVGKTTILEAIKLVLSGSSNYIEKQGLHSLFNIQIVEEYMKSEKNINELPEVEIELFISDSIESEDLNGVHHSHFKSDPLNGLKLIIKPDHKNYSNEIKSSINNSSFFPYEYYQVEFRTFSGVYYSPFQRYKGYIKCNFIRNNINDSYRIMRDYIDSMYESHVKPETRRVINAKFRKNTMDFTENLYSEELQGNNKRFDFNHVGSNSFQNNLTVIEQGVDINYLGHGEKLLLKVESGLNKDMDIGVTLMEEPENHLSYSNMHKLIEYVNNSDSSQMFITTHNNMIASRLNLQNLILLSENTACSLRDISDDTANYFMKAVDTNLLNFILCNKTILVEGNAEYILLEEFYKIIGSNDPMTDHVSIISCGGITFKRYLEIAKILNKKVAVITDNDGKEILEIINSYEIDNYKNIKIFTDADIRRFTFEVCLYNDNKETFEEKLLSSQMKNGLQQYMLKKLMKIKVSILIKECFR